MEVAAMEVLKNAILDWLACKLMQRLKWKIQKLCPMCNDDMTGGEEMSNNSSGDDMSNSSSEEEDDKICLCEERPFDWLITEFFTSITQEFEWEKFYKWVLKCFKRLPSVSKYLTLTFLYINFSSPEELKNWALILKYDELKIKMVFEWDIIHNVGWIYDSDSYTVPHDPLNLNLI